ncbi:hypothetical protein INS49_007961 [Diaporthe citri]|uniref:uncharacterized protein n=1 Tax=Diaporthe citri TaxID=83186 RepID=UPI001C8163D5|nr:uncharacterized protein INS49_007961 [Diaporthe citri]KAG6362866.1 hypothetical protein INS49_007961 [Diaporthe citri]
MPASSLAGSLSQNAVGTATVVIESILLVLVFLSIGLRLWSRVLLQMRLEANDYLILVAAILMTSRYGVEMTTVIKCGQGLHQEYVKATAGSEMITLFLKLVYVLDLHWLTLVTLIKLSILHFYSVVFRKDLFAKAVYGAMAIVIAYWIGTFWADAFLCDPPRKAWDVAIPGKCGNANMMYTAMASADLIIDIIVILLPMPILWTLQLRTSKKILLTAIFGLGFMYEFHTCYEYAVMKLTATSIIGITCVRIKYMLELDPTDITYTFAPLALIAAIVPLLGIINASLPTMRPALERIFGPKWRFGSSGGSSGRRRWYKYNSRDPRHLSGTEENNNQRRDSETELVTIGGTVYDPRAQARPGRIQVTRDWDVSSAHSSREGDKGANVGA